MTSRFMKVARIGATSLIALAAACVAALAFALPAAAAAVCPSCYGFEYAADRTFVERGASPEERARLVAVVAEGRQRVQKFWGNLGAAPKVLVCTTDNCFRRIGGGRRRGMSIFDRVAILSPLGSDAVIAAHELSMNELNHRIGALGVVRGTVPIWFNEGIAMYASDDLRYLAPPGAGDRCLVPAAEPLPVGVFEWNRRALDDNRLYAKAACSTSRWISLHGGPSAAVSLVSKVSAGAAFQEVAR